MEEDQIIELHARLGNRYRIVIDFSTSSFLCYLQIPRMVTLIVYFKEKFSIFYSKKK